MAAAVIARLSGVVSYTDGTTAEFAVHLDQKGNLSYNSKTESIQSMVENKADTESRLDSMFALLSGLAFSGPEGSAQRTINGLYAELSGRVSVDVPTSGNVSWKDFIVQYTSRTGAVAPKGGSNSTSWSLAKSTGLSALNSMFADLGIVAS